MSIVVFSLRDEVDDSRFKVPISKSVPYRLPWYK